MSRYSFFPEQFRGAMLHLISLIEVSGNACSSTGFCPGIPGEGFTCGEEDVGGEKIVWHYSEPRQTWKYSHQAEIRCLRPLKRQAHLSRSLTALRSTVAVGRSSALKIIKCAREWRAGRLVWFHRGGPAPAQCPKAAFADHPRLQCGGSAKFSALWGKMRICDPRSPARRYRHGNKTLRAAWCVCCTGSLASLACQNEEASQRIWFCREVCTPK